MPAHAYMPSDDDVANARLGLTVLGIETSCDETAAAVVTRSADGKGHMQSNIVGTQFDDHRAFGGVVPEIAARAHAASLDHIIDRALSEAGLALHDIDAVAATAGPGLVGGLIVGAITGKAIALSVGKPFLAINHLEAHALSVGLTDGIQPPYVMLLVSGGHTQLLFVEGIGRYRRLATTIDDALGEAFDKTAKLMGLGIPGGPAVERAAKTGDDARFALPRPMLGREDPHFSFAGLKTAVRHAAAPLAPLSAQDISDLAASFQRAAFESVADRVNQVLIKAIPKFANERRRFVVAGGVAANANLRAKLHKLAEDNGYVMHVPPPALCTDNGAMIAWAGAEHLARGLADGLDAPVRPRWPLDATAPPAIGAGVKA